MKDWIRTQQSTPLHIAAILLFPLVVFFSYQSTVLLIVGYVAFFLATSIKMIWKMVIIMAIVAIAVMVLPFLAPIALIVMIVLFIMRIGYVFKNWRPFVSGLTVYGSSFYLWGRAQEYM
ncbi:hypothetical protein, partial [Fredinandcohnia sp. 179-A 10B2 NHS]|uniref:hypothetical protein n=1 Tax=Fredinandcohnia sp. 179-A 10B2 NHS TaxID=3235176 RepID=UPI0039A2AF24